MFKCRCFHFQVSGGSTLSADIGEEFGGRPRSLERRKVAGWTARKPERACIFHLRHEPAKGCRAIIPRFSEGSAPRWERSAVSDSPAGKKVVPEGETISRRDEVQAIAMP